MQNNQFSIENEQSVIGALLIDNSKLESVLEIIDTDDFSNEHNKVIFNTMKEMHQLSVPFDLTTLPACLNKSGLFGQKEGEIIAYLGDIAKTTSSAANVLPYAKIVKEKANKKALINLLEESKNKTIQGANPEKIISDLAPQLENLQQSYTSHQPKLKAVELSEFLATELPARELILNPWLPKAGLAMIHARPGIGKTHLSFGIAYAVASGGEFLGWKAEKPRGVLLIDGEMPAPAAQDRWAQVVDMNDCKYLPAKLSFLTPDLQTSGMPDLGTKEGQAEVNTLINDDIDLIILDNLSCLIRTGKENDGDSWQTVQTWVLSLRAKGKSVLLIHHQGKTGSQRGSSKKEDVLDTVIALKRPDDYVSTQGSRFIVNFEKTRGFFGDDAKSFEAHLSTDTDGKPCWMTRNVEEGTYQKVVSMFNDGMSQTEIARELSINKSSVTYHTKKARDKGLLKNGGLKDA